MPKGTSSKPRKKPSERHSDPQFVEVFLANFEKGGYAGVAKALNMAENSVTQRASKLRSAGVPLPAKERAIGSKTSVADLNALVAKSLGKSVEEVTKLGEENAKKAQERAQKREAEKSSSK